MKKKIKKKDPCESQWAHRKAVDLLITETDHLAIILMAYLREFSII